jgi:hypothetical protein
MTHRRHHRKHHRKHHAKSAHKRSLRANRTDKKTQLLLGALLIGGVAAWYFMGSKKKSAPGPVLPASMTNPTVAAPPPAAKAPPAAGPDTYDAGGSTSDW